MATDIPEAVALQGNGVYLADSHAAFVAGVGRALADGGGPRRARAQAMARESWDEKVAEIERLVTEQLLMEP